MITVKDVFRNEITRQLSDIYQKIHAAEHRRVFSSMIETGEGVMLTSVAHPNAAPEPDQDLNDTSLITTEIDIMDINEMKTRVEAAMAVEPTQDQRLEASYAEYMFMFGKQAHDVAGEFIGNLYKKGYLHGLAAKRNDS